MILNEKLAFGASEAFEYGLKELFEVQERIVNGHGGICIASVLNLEPCTQFVKRAISKYHNFMPRRVIKVLTQKQEMMSGRKIGS